jgi:hypothetical protein
VPLYQEICQVTHVVPFVHPSSDDMVCLSMLIVWRMTGEVSDLLNDAVYRVIMMRRRSEVRVSIMHNSSVSAVQRSEKIRSSIAGDLLHLVPLGSASIAHIPKCSSHR